MRKQITSVASNMSSQDVSCRRNSEDAMAEAFGVHVHVLSRGKPFHPQQSDRHQAESFLIIVRGGEERLCDNLPR